MYVEVTDPSFEMAGFCFDGDELAVAAGRHQVS
jgi:hypothetical protein